MNDAGLHAAVQLQADFGQLLAVGIGIITAALVLSKKAFGLPVKGDHRSAASFINIILTMMFAVAANVATFVLGFYSLYAITLFGLMFITQIIGFFLESGPPTRASIFSIAMVMAVASLYASSGIAARLSDQTQQLLSLLIKSYEQTTDNTVSALERLVKKLK